MLKIYNTLTRRLEIFTPRDEGKVYMYVCGLTPYDYPHVGHGRSAVVYDVIHRYFEYLGFEVIHISNFTDIDDKIIDRSKELGIPYKELAEKFAAIFIEELDKLNVKKLQAYPKATEHINEIIEMVKELVDKGFAYEISDGVYFDINKFSDYGKLSHRNISELRSGARVEVNPEKKDPLDFALWKKAKLGEPSWDSPWGKGRPGWHIECSVMSLKYLKNGFDIHGGGDDLIFPHHENEIAQSEACAGEAPFARFWVHNGMVEIDKEKMSKSLKNFFRLDKLLEDYDGEVVRLFIISISYRKPLNFDLESLESAKKNYAYFNESYFELKNSLNERRQEGIEITASVKRWRDDFENAMNDDFNTPVVIALLHEIFKFFNSNKDSISEDGLISLNELLVNIFSVLGLEHVGEKREESLKTIKGKLLNIVEQLNVSELMKASLSVIDHSMEASQIIETLIEIRNNLRKQKNFKESDMIRNSLKEAGVVLEDTKEGTKYKLVMTDEQ